MTVFFWHPLKQRHIHQHDAAKNQFNRVSWRERIRQGLRSILRLPNKLGRFFLVRCTHQSQKSGKSTIARAILSSQSTIQPAIAALP